jgi:hypothetical protein
MGFPVWRGAFYALAQTGDEARFQAAVELYYEAAARELVHIALDRSPDEEPSVDLVVAGARAVLYGVIGDLARAEEEMLVMRDAAVLRYSDSEPARTVRRQLFGFERARTPQQVHSQFDNCSHPSLYYMDPILCGAESFAAAPRVVRFQPFLYQPAAALGAADAFLPRLSPSLFRRPDQALYLDAVSAFIAACLDRGDFARATRLAHALFVAVRNTEQYADALQQLRTQEDPAVDGYPRRPRAETFEMRDLWWRLAMDVHEAFALAALRTRSLALLELAIDELKSFAAAAPHVFPAVPASSLRHAQELAMQTGDLARAARWTAAIEHLYVTAPLRESQLIEINARNSSFRGSLGHNYLFQAQRAEADAAHDSAAPSDRVPLKMELGAVSVEARAEFAARSRNFGQLREVYDVLRAGKAFTARFRSRVVARVLQTLLRVNDTAQRNHSLGAAARRLTLNVLTDAHLRGGLRLAPGAAAAAERALRSHPLLAQAPAPVDAATRLETLTPGQVLWLAQDLQQAGMALTPEIASAVCALLMQLPGASVLALRMLQDLVHSGAAAGAVALDASGLATVVFGATLPLQHVLYTLRDGSRATPAAMTAALHRAGDLDAPLPAELAARAVRALGLPANAAPDAVAAELRRRRAEADAATAAGPEATAAFAAATAAPPSAAEWAAAAEGRVAAGASVVSPLTGSTSLLGTGLAALGESLHPVDDLLASLGPTRARSLLNARGFEAVMRFYAARGDRAAVGFWLRLALDATRAPPPGAPAREGSVDQRVRLCSPLVGLLKEEADPTLLLQLGWELEDDVLQGRPVLAPFFDKQRYFYRSREPFASRAPAVPAAAGQAAAAAQGDAIAEALVAQALPAARPSARSVPWSLEAAARYAVTQPRLCALLGLPVVPADELAAASAETGAPAEVWLAPRIAAAAAAVASLRFRPSATTAEVDRAVAAGLLPAAGAAASAAAAAAADGEDALVLPAVVDAVEAAASALTPREAADARTLRTVPLLSSPALAQVLGNLHFAHPLAEAMQRQFLEAARVRSSTMNYASTVMAAAREAARTAPRPQELCAPASDGSVTAVNAAALLSVCPVVPIATAAAGGAAAAGADVGVPFSPPVHAEGVRAALGARALGGNLATRFPALAVVTGSAPELATFFPGCGADSPAAAAAAARLGAPVGAGPVLVDAVLAEMAQRAVLAPVSIAAAARALLTARRADLALPYFAVLVLSLPALPAEGAGVRARKLTAAHLEPSTGREVDYRAQLTRNAALSDALRYVVTLRPSRAAAAAAAVIPSGASVAARDRLTPAATASLAVVAKQLRAGLFIFAHAANAMAAPRASPADTLVPAVAVAAAATVANARVALCGFGAAPLALPGVPYSMAAVLRSLGELRRVFTRLANDYAAAVHGRDVRAVARELARGRDADGSAAAPTAPEPVAVVAPWVQPATFDAALVEPAAADFWLLFRGALAVEDPVQTLAAVEDWGDALERAHAAWAFAREAAEFDRSVMPGVARAAAGLGPPRLRGEHAPLCSLRDSVAAQRAALGLVPSPMMLQCVEDLAAVVLEAAEEPAGAAEWRRRQRAFGEALLRQVARARVVVAKIADVQRMEHLLDSFVHDNDDGYGVAAPMPPSAAATSSLLMPHEPRTTLPARHAAELPDLHADAPAHREDLNNIMSWVGMAPQPFVAGVPAPIVLRAKFGVDADARASEALYTVLRDFRFAADPLAALISAPPMNQAPAHASVLQTAHNM